MSLEKPGFCWVGGVGMGVIRFLTPQPERVSAEAVARAFVAGWDCVPTPSRKTWEEGNLLRVERSITDSGNLYIPWRVAGHGELLLRTASLMERPRPYHLPVELARGTLNRLRTRADLWRMGGLQLSDALTDQLRAAVAAFERAATSQHDVPAAAEAAEETLRLSLDGMLLLTAEYARQVLAFRHETGSSLETLLGGNLGPEVMHANAEPMFGAAFNTATVPLAWNRAQPADQVWEWGVSDKQMQFCVRHGLKVLGGPLLQLDRRLLPDWAGSPTADFERLVQAVRQFITRAVERYRGRVHLWHCVGAINRTGDWPLTDEQKMRLAIAAIDATRRVDPRTPVIISFDQPWGEYMTEESTDWPPYYFADTLVRAELGIAGLGLELNLGYWPGGSLPRDPLEISDLIDQWSMLGLPLIVMLTLPSSAAADPAARPGTGQPVTPFLAEELTPQTHKLLVERLLPMLLAKQCVQALVWNQVFDAGPQKFPHAGLFNAEGMPKPALSSLLALRREHLE